jgi:3D (Asp-Asp-Asp) domain-containing protein
LGAGATGGSGAPDAGAPQTIDHLVTFYGWPDNSPPGNGIAYPKLHKEASSTRTYADPITFASDPNEWPPGTILYLPYLERYVIMEDSCADCMTDWKNGKRHIDVWLDSDGRLDSQVLACENALTRNKTAVEVMPPADRPVNATPLFDQAAGTCNAP